MPPRWSDEEEDEEERFPALHPVERSTHLRRLARRMAPDPARLSRPLGFQYLFLALLVALLVLFGPALGLRLPRELWWLVPLYLLGALSLLRNRRRRR
ncbi:MAG: hypothetical protein QME79_08800 [Bacillota bacterium]|nr:hypothetical protein [Bacillota bacterium]